MADALFEVRHGGAGLTLVTDAGISTATVAVGLGRVMLAVAQPGGAADLLLDPVDARHLAERILLAAGEVETAAEAGAEDAA
ncbi:hypothetical protein DA075_10085 [Methylobacterium currus]|uniref:Uncharacterized protein n=1 Tax=Methylobacterium currus TaxID=2051553 RepID=A0A2R4WI47_9HYPH|nr:hypothetical protein [Methylobacterium currus]AWB21221.1 hypothetical protein DA075_10085 [Methylobacterium currus]